MPEIFYPFSFEISDTMFIKSYISVLAFCAIVSANFDDAKHGSSNGRGIFGGPSGFGCSCLVVATTETNCTGVSGKSCSDSASLLTLVAAGATSVPVCSAQYSTPTNHTINFRLPIQSCRRCNCFTAPVTETRNCTALNTDTNFVKNGCSDQTSLADLARNGNQARVCVFGRFGNLIQTSTVDIIAGISGRF